MALKREIDKLNRILAADLGRNPSGSGGIYEWRFSETWMHDFLDPNPNLVTVERGEEEIPVVVDDRQAFRRKMCPERYHQWVLAMWSPPPATESEWVDAYRGTLPWPSSGYYAPTNVHLDPFVVPTKDVTMEVIGMIRKERTKTRQDYMDEAQEHLDREEQAESSRLDSMVADACTAFGNAKPGCVGNGISFPLIAKTNGGGKGAKTEVVA